MNSKEVSEDAAFFLYLVPIVASIVYGVYEWYLLGPRSSSMPTDAYLIVSKDPYLFLLSLIAVCLAIVIEVRETIIGDRFNVISENTTRLQVLAIVVLIISFCAGLSVAGYGDAAGGLANFLTGRYALIYAFFLLGISILISSRQFLGKAGPSFVVEFIGLILMALSPVVLYGGLKIHMDFAASGVAAIVTFAIGVFLFASKNVLFAKKGTQRKAAIQQN